MGSAVPAVLTLLGITAELAAVIRQAGSWCIRFYPCSCYVLQRVPRTAWPCEFHLGHWNAPCGSLNVCAPSSRGAAGVHVLAPSLRAAQNQPSHGVAADFTLHDAPLCAKHVGVLHPCRVGLRQTRCSNISDDRWGVSHSKVRSESVPVQNSGNSGLPIFTAADHQIGSHTALARWLACPQYCGLVQHINTC